MGWQNGAAWLSNDGGWYKNVAATGTPFSITYVSNNSTTTMGGAVTFTSQNIGTADPTRIVVVALDHGPNSGVSVTSVTIGGVTATQAPSADSGGSGVRSDIWYLAVPTGTTANIVVTAATETRCALGVYSVVGATAHFSVAIGNFTASSVTTLSASAVTVPAGGGAIVIVSTHNATETITPSNYTADVAGLVVGTSTTSFGHDTSHTGSTVYGASWGTSTDCSISVAVFGP
jgi:hypothetical protein